MKAKHTIARIKGLAIWQKILCAAMAVLLLSLMVPNGLRANATEDVNGEPQVDSFEATAEEVTNNLGESADNGILDLLPRVGSSVDFIRQSVNVAETAGTFTTQSMDKNLLEILAIVAEYLPNIVTTPHPTNEMELRDSIVQLDNALAYDLENLSDSNKTRFSLIYTILLKYCDYNPGQGDVTADMENAIWVPDLEPFFPKNGEEANSDEVNAPVQWQTILRAINHLILLDKPIKEIDNPNDSSIVMFYVTLGSGSIEQIISDTKIHVLRLLPVIPALFDNHPRELLGAENADNAVNAQAFFMNWDISFDNGRGFIPTDWIERLGNTPLIPVYSDSKYIVRANFLDLEGFVQVHLDFSDAYLSPDFCYFLRNKNWFTTGVGNVGSSVWTTVYPEWTPLWYVYNDIFSTFGEPIFEGAVFKDQNLAHAIKRNADLYSAGPHWVECDNDNFFGTLDKETTFTFSMYPVSPMGHVSSFGLQSIRNDMFGSAVGYADVMYYNEWGMPLFNPSHAQYVPFGYYYDGELEEVDNMYMFTSQEFYVEDPADLPEDFDPSYLDYCFDTQIDHVVIKAYGNDIWDYGSVYIPKMVDGEDLAKVQSDFIFNGQMNFDVEKLGFAKFEPGFPDGLESYDVTFYEDGEPLFDTITLSNFFETQFFAIPVAYNGTVKVDTNLDFVSSFDAYFDYWRPWASDPMNAFRDPSQFDPTPGVTHNFEVRVHANAAEGYLPHSWSFDYLLPLYAGHSLPVIDLQPVIDYHVFGANFEQAAAINIAGGEGHSTFHVDYNIDGAAAYAYDMVGGSDSVYSGTQFIVNADGTLHGIHEDGLIFTHTEDAIVTAVGAPGYQVTSWTINGVNYPVGAEAVAATATPDSPVTIVAYYNGNGPDNPGGGTAQTGDSMGFAFAILAMIALAGAGIIAGRRIYNK